jgi:hypothetical protein
VVIELGVALAAVAEQPHVDQPDRAGGDPVPVQAAALQVAQGRSPQLRQRLGEAQHVVELLRVALLAPLLVVEVLRPTPAVYPPVACICPAGSAEIHTLVHAGGRTSALMRARVPASVTGVPAASV